ncbi:hypothetical protein DFJ77DRAFT_291323 [Powellomyces hirtus]|nr:hypothetical protein DFJ77DRAFT_291323 [Powellomyces hirtus]
MRSIGTISRLGLRLYSLFVLSSPVCSDVSGPVPNWLGVLLAISPSFSLEVGSIWCIFDGTDRGRCGIQRSCYGTLSHRAQSRSPHNGSHYWSDGPALGTRICQSLWRLLTELSFWQGFLYI